MKITEIIITQFKGIMSLSETGLQDINKQNYELRNTIEGEVNY